MGHNSKAHRSKRKGRNDSQSRRSYWASGRLEERKIKAIMLNEGCTRAEAYIQWHDSRKGRIKVNSKQTVK